MIGFICWGFLASLLNAYLDKGIVIIGVHYNRTLLKALILGVTTLIGTLINIYVGSTLGFFEIYTKGALLIWGVFYLCFSYLKNLLEGKRSLLYIGREAGNDKITRWIWGTWYEFGGLIQRLVFMVAMIIIVQVV